MKGLINMIKQEKKAKNLGMIRVAIFLIILAFIITAIAPLANFIMQKITKGDGLSDKS